MLVESVLVVVRMGILDHTVITHVKPESMGKTVLFYVLLIAMGHVDIQMDPVKIAKKVGKAIAPTNV